jgi:hypothetical protein
MQPKTILELNATYPVITRITIQLEADENDKTAKDMLSMLWDTDLLSSGFSLSTASVFKVMVNRMVAIAPDVADQPEELPMIVDPTKLADDGKSGSVRQSRARSQNARAHPGAPTDLRNPRFAVPTEHSPGTSTTSTLVSISSEPMPLFFLR